MNIDKIISDARLLCSNGRYGEALNHVNVGLIYFPRNKALIDIFESIPSQYDSNFFDSAYTLSHSSAKHFLSHLNTVYDYKSVIDVGAGVGAWSHAATDLGKEVISVDGEWVQNLVKPCPTLTYKCQNLNDRLQLDFRSDLAVCVEVAEHLKPERSESFIGDLCALSDAVVFGAALPRQGGSGHINCRPHSFWIELFQRNGFSALDVFRPKFWYDGSVGPWYAQNTYLFVSGKILSQFDGVALRPSLVDVYHPRVVLDTPICLTDHESGKVDPAA